MGLFNRRKKQEPTIVEKREPKNPMEILDDTDKGVITAEYIEEHADFKKFYDTTKLRIHNKPINIEGVPVYSAQVAWYGQNDAVYFGENGEDVGRRGQMTDIKLEIDMNKLRTDPEYQQTLMLGLLDKKRVEKYMQMGMEEQATQPCGNYIGGVTLSSKTMQYSKYFRTHIGKVVHQSPEMAEKRQEYQDEQRRMKEAIKREKQAQIERLQREIEEL